MRSLQALLAATLLSAAVAGDANGQLSNSGGPFTYSADLLNYLEKENQLVLIGNVDVVQDDTRLQADRLTLFLRDADGAAQATVGADDIERILAEGDVHLVRGEQITRGDQAIYDAATDTVTFTGNVVAANKDLVTRGQTLVFEVSTGIARFNPNRQPGQRVQGRFDPKGAPKPKRPDAPARTP